MLSLIMYVIAKQPHFHNDQIVFYLEYYESAHCSGTNSQEKKEKSLTKCLIPDQ